MSFFARIRNLWRREQIDAEIEEELRSHLELAAEDAERAGVASAEAQRAARLRFGSSLSIRERTAEADTVQWIEALARDLRHAVRQLRTAPAFAATAVITLALGIGATTAIFTLIEQVMLRSLPVSHPERLWRIGDVVGCCHANGYAQGDWNFFSWEAYHHFRANTPAFEDLAAFQVGNAGLGIRRQGSAAPAVPANGEYVSGNFFRTLGAAAWRGRLFADADDREGLPAVAVMSFHTWQARYGSDPGVVGATFQVNSQALTVIGITPPGFFGVKSASGNMPDFWLPLASEPRLEGSSSRLRNNGEAWLGLIGRVRPDANPRALEAQLRVELRQWLESHLPDMVPQETEQLSRQSLSLSPGGTGLPLMREQFKDGLQLLFAAALCVLLVACANTANLLLARGMKDRSATALRAALGASRARLVSKALAESLTLAVFGGVAGIAVAYGGAGLILRLAFTERGAWVPVTAAPSLPVLGFALGVALCTAVLFGIVPAWVASRVNPSDALRGASRAVRGRQPWAQKALVAGQVAMSLVLLSAAALLGRSVRNLERQDFGFDTNGRYLVAINTKLAGYRQEQLTPLFAEIEDRLSGIPGVRMASPALYAPIGGLYWAHEIRIEGQPEPGGAEDLSSAWTRVTPRFFQTMGDRIMMGRAIGEQDTAVTRPVAVVNRAFAKRFFGEASPIGRHFGPAPRKNAAQFEIVGVAADMHYVASDTADDVTPMYFVPESQTAQFTETHLASREAWSHYLYNIVIWAPGDPPNLESQVRRALAIAAPNVVVSRVQSYRDVIRDSFAEQNGIAGLTSLFGVLGLVLAAIGLYGVTAYTVEQRTAEIGVRMALGAGRLDVVTMVLRSSLGHVAAGLLLGIPASIAAGYVISGRLFGVAPWDPLMLSAASVLLVFSAVIAAVIPGRRAAGVDPMQALRAE